MKEITAILLFLVSVAYGQGSQTNSPKRIKKTVDYVSHSFSIPVKINDSTATKFLETEYIYSGELLVGIKRSYFRDNKALKTEYDSIKYLSNDSVFVYSTSEKGNYDFYLRLSNFNQLREEMKAYKPLKHYSDDHRILVEQKGPNRLKYYKKMLHDDGYEYTASIHYQFDSLTRIYEIVEKRRKSNISGWLRFDYADNELTIHSGSGQNWQASTKYFFNDKGLLIMKGEESDTNPSIIVYEYEKGRGNAGSFINSIYDIIYCKPLIE